MWPRTRPAIRELSWRRPKPVFCCETSCGRGRDQRSESLLGVDRSTSFHMKRLGATRPAIREPSWRGPKHVDLRDTSWTRGHDQRSGEPSWRRSRRHAASPRQRVCGRRCAGQLRFGVGRSTSFHVKRLGPQIRSAIREPLWRRQNHVDSRETPLGRGHD